MQLLVVVANIQMRNLKTEVEKGFIRTAVGHGLVDPKRQRRSAHAGFASTLEREWTDVDHMQAIVDDLIEKLEVQEIDVVSENCVESHRNWRNYHSRSLNESWVVFHSA